VGSDRHRSSPDPGMSTFAVVKPEPAAYMLWCTRYAYLGAPVAGLFYGFFSFGTACWVKSLEKIPRDLPSITLIPYREASKRI